MSHSFFYHQLNYSMSNEDCRLERAIVHATSRSRILSVCGSGARSLCLIQQGVELLDIVDLSITQLLWGKLRLCTLQRIDFASFQKFWGYEDCVDRKHLFSFLLDGELDTLQNIFTAHQWSPPLYYGKWEKTFFALSRVVQMILRGKRIQEIFDSKDIEQQWARYQSLGFRLRWKLILFLLGNRAIFNTLLYKGSFVQKNIAISHYRYYLEAYDRIFKQGLVRSNFFAQLCFYGKVLYPEGYFIEADKAVWRSITECLPRVTVNFFHRDLFDQCAQKGSRYDFISLSNIPSYLGGQRERSFLQELKPALVRGGIVVVRYYLRECQPISDGFIDITERYRHLIEQEFLQMYRISIYERE